MVIGVDYNNIGSKGSKILSKVHIPLLSTLLISNCICMDVGSCQITNEGAKHLAKSKWSNLSVL